MFVQCKYEWFQRFLDRPNGVPCPDTFARVFARIDPEQFRDCFMDWVSSVNRLTQGLENARAKKISGPGE